jgi:type II secretory pathway pseudopilin PulG
MKRAFTLIEVNLAIMVMAVGILGIISLYALAYREERQSREDVASAAYADAVMGPLVTALTATNVTWSNFKKIQKYPSDGWLSYIADKEIGRVEKDPDTRARAVYSSAIGSLSAGFNASWPVTSKEQVGNLKAALVIIRDGAIVRISFRAVDKENFLFAAPLYYTEARFQGVME